MPRAALCALVLTAIATRASGAPDTIPLKLPSGKTLTLELMIQPVDREMGLMFRPSLPQDRALLFIFERLDFHAIWMKNCKFPIDIVWLDEKKKVVHVEESVPPCRVTNCPVYAPQQRAAYVVELNAGQARREKAAVGSLIGFELPR